MNSKPLVSVIVPIYKSEKYICKCVDSILGQTYRNIELLLVDDGSPDNSGKICNEYAHKDPRAKVFHQANAGVSTARNLALDNTESKWVMFVDSDDWLERGCIARCVDIAEKNRLELLQFASKRVDDEGNILVDRETEGTDVMGREEYVNSAGRLRVSVWGNLLRNDIIQKCHIRFDANLKLGEDQLFIFEYTYHCKRCMKIPDTLYNYRFNPNSATATTNPWECIKSINAFQRFEYRSFFEFYIQRGILRYFLYPIMDSHILSQQEMYRLIAEESFSLLSPIYKFERPFFPLFNISRRIGFIYLVLARILLNKKHNANG